MKNINHFLRTPQGKFLAGIGAIIVLLFVYYFANGGGVTTQEVQEVSVTESDHVRGAKGAKVTIVEFGDFQCPACAAYEGIVQKVQADNKDTVQVVFKHFPLTQIHHNALFSAKASEAASLQGKFWEMHDMLYDKQKEWGEALNARDYFITYATTLGLDIKKFEADLANAESEKKIIAEQKEGLRLGVQGTPTFFVNGVKLEQNPQSVDAFNKIIKDALTKANEVK